MQFTWELVEFKETEMKIQLYWDNPGLISISNDGPQRLQITFNSQILFKDIEGKAVYPR